LTMEERKRAELTKKLFWIRTTALSTKKPDWGKPAGLLHRFPMTGGGQCEEPPRTMRAFHGVHNLIQGVSHGDRVKNILCILIRMYRGRIANVTGTRSC